MGNPIFDELFFQKNENNEKPKNFKLFGRTKKQILKLKKWKKKNAQNIFPYSRGVR